LNFTIGKLLAKWTNREGLVRGHSSLRFMVRALYTFSVLTLISAGVVFMLCLAQWLRGGPEIEQNASLSIAEKFGQAGEYSEKSSQKTLSPHVKQAKAFALYLNPPQPPNPEQAPVPGGTLTQTLSAGRAVESKPNFRLFATSYYRSRPEESMALVSESGGRPRWIKQGTLLGRFVVMKVMRGKIVYKDDHRLGEMTVDKKIPVPTAIAPRTTLASDQTSASSPRSSSIRKPRGKTHKLTLARPETLPIDPEEESGR